MKRSEMVEDLAAILGDPWIFLTPKEYADKMLAYIEQKGMLPPTQSPSLIEVDGVFKHGTALRIWDEE